MLSAELAALVRHRRYPSVSVLVDLDSGRGSWRSRLEALERDAHARLDREVGAGAVPELRSSLQEAVQQAEPEQGAKAIAVYVDARGARVISLPVGVRDRVVVDETFATRDLVHAVNRTPSYWLLALDLRRPQLLQGVGTELRRVPLPLGDPLPPANDTGRRARHPVDDRRVRRLRRLRDIEAAVSHAISDPDAPLVVVGPEPTASQFASLAAPRRLAIIRRSSNGGATTLFAAAEAELRRLDEERCNDALAELDRHVSAGRVAAGMDAAWKQAHLAGGAVVLVEVGFEYPAVLSEDGELHASDTRDAPGVIDDAVDELIEAVLQRGGRSQILPDGLLERFGRVVLLTRQPVA